MRGGYLTLDLRELTNAIDKLYKKGIYNYILNTNKPIEILISQGAINEFIGDNKGVLCKNFRVNLSELLAMQYNLAVLHAVFVLTCRFCKENFSLM